MAQLSVMNLSLITAPAVSNNANWSLFICVRVAATNLTSMVVQSTVSSSFQHVDDDDGGYLYFRWPREIPIAADLQPQVAVRNRLRTVLMSLKKSRI